MGTGALVAPPAFRGSPPGRRALLAAILLSLWGAASLAACGGGDEQATAVVRAFVEGLQQSAHGAAGPRRAFEALCPAEREALRRRARQASGLSGRKLEPWELWVTGRARFPAGLSWPQAALRMAPSGEAFVEVPAADGSLRLRVERAEGRWCVRLPPALDAPEAS